MTKPYKTTLNKLNCSLLLCIAAGGSGGHILPALQLARQWRKQNPTSTTIAFCSKKNLDKELFQQDPDISAVHPIHLTSFSFKRLWLIPVTVFQLIKATINAWRLFRHQRPTKIISTGGIEAVPVCLAGWFLKIPIDLYELNVEPGKAIKLLAPFATTIHLVFQATQQHLKYFASKCKITPYPLRFSVDEYNKKEKLAIIEKINASKARTDSLFHQHRTTLLILGGSQGSVFLNNLVKNLVNNYPDIRSSLQIIHQTGTQNNNELLHCYQEHGIPAEVFSYYNDVHEYYAVADIVLCRAGAGTLFELLFFEKKSIVVPLIAATTHHQMANAQEMAKLRPDLFTVVPQEGIERTSYAIHQLLV